MEQARLFRMAPEAIHCQAVFVPGDGWRLTVGMRRQDEDWSDAYRAEYTHLSTDELGDVLCAEACRQLGIL